MEPVKTVFRKVVDCPDPPKLKFVMIDDDFFLGQARVPKEKEKGSKVVETVVPSKCPGDPDKKLKVSGSGSKRPSSHESEAEKPSERGGGFKNGVQEMKRKGEKKDKDKKHEHRKCSKEEKDGGKSSRDNERKARSRERTHASERKQDKERRRNLEHRKEMERKEKKADKGRETVSRANGGDGKRVMTPGKAQDAGTKIGKETKSQAPQYQRITSSFSSLPIKSRPAKKIAARTVFPPRYQSEFMKMVFQDVEPDFIAALHFQPKHKRSSKKSNASEPERSKVATTTPTPTAAAPKQGMENGTKKRKLEPDSGISSLADRQPQKKVKLDLGKVSGETKKKLVPKKAGPPPSGGQNPKPAPVKPNGTKKRARSRSMDSAYDSDRFEKGQAKKKARRSSPPRKAMEKADFEKARELAKKINEIREKYELEFKSKEMKIRQRAVAMYFIDKLAFRIGNEKGQDKTDAVGCCSLNCEHIKLYDEKEGVKRVVEIDYRGKDSARYQKEFQVDKQVFKSLKIFVREKKAGDALFDWLETASMKKHLEDLMEGLTAKVFRVFNASQAFQKNLDEATPKDGAMAHKISAYHGATRAVATKLDEKPLADPKCGTEKGKTVPLELLSYLDPRITVAWCKKNGVRIEYVYNESRRSNFRWAIEETDKSFRFE